jgi:rRNA-processing protein FCF1
MNNSNSDDLMDNDEWAFSLADVVDFLQDAWKTLLGGALAGLVLAVLGWLAVGKYTAESVMVNNKVSGNAITVGGKPVLDASRAIDLISWRSLSQSLPNLASELLDKGVVPEAERSQMGAMSNPAWWGSSVKPTFSLSKADAKELAVISKEMQESGSADILNLVVKTRGGSEAAAAANAKVATDFIMQGGAYLSVREAVNRYESQVLTVDSDLQKKITDREVELRFMRERAKRLEDLRTRFPGNVVVGSQQVVDLKDSNAKYMPISTQIVAVQSDINAAQEDLARMRDKLAQSALLRAFVTKAQEETGKLHNGFALIDQLLKIVDGLRTAASQDDENAQLVLNTLQADLVKARTFYTKGLEIRLAPSVTPPALALPLVGGLLLGGFAMLVFLLLRIALKALRAKQALAQAQAA